MPSPPCAVFHGHSRLCDQAWTSLSVHNTVRDSGNVATREWDSPKFALGADGGWIEKENDIRDVDEISSRRMRNSSAKGAGIRDQDAPTPLSRPHFMWVFPRMKLNPGYILI